MTPISFPHQQFLENNKDVLSVHPLPELLQKRISGFEELERDLIHTSEEDHDLLLDKLEKLSYELDEDLEEYFATYLENNDEKEEEPSVPLSQEFSPGIVADAPNDQLIPQVEEKQVLHPTETSDNSILQSLLDQQRTSVHPIELRKMGFKGALEQPVVVSGKFLLHRGKYETYYQIERQEY